MREVFLDIETIPCEKGVWERLSERDDSLAKKAWSMTALDWSLGRIVCIGLVVDEGAQEAAECLAGTDETKLLTDFWKILRPADYLIGHNLIGFDIPFIQARSVINKVKPSRAIDLRRYSTAGVYDTMQVWSNWDRQRFPKLDLLATVLGLGGKSGSGDQVAHWVEQGDWARLKDYCMQDVRLTREIYRRMRAFGM